MRTFEFLAPAAWVHQVPAPGGQTHILHLVVLAHGRHDEVCPSKSLVLIKSRQDSEMCQVHAEQ